MLFVIYARDKDGAEAVRLANRAAHLKYVDDSGVTIMLGGPMLSDDGQAMRGSMLVLEADSAAEAETFAASDPYRLAGLFESVEIHPFRKVFPR